MKTIAAAFVVGFIIGVVVMYQGEPPYSSPVEDSLKTVIQDAKDKIDFLIKESVKADIKADSAFKIAQEHKRNADELKKKIPVIRPIPINSLDSFFIKRYGPGAVIKRDSAKSSPGAPRKRPIGQLSSRTGQSDQFVNGDGSTKGSGDRHPDSDTAAEERANNGIGVPNSAQGGKDTNNLQGGSKTKKTKAINPNRIFDSNRLINIQINLKA